jgi:hypothetical protein
MRLGNPMTKRQQKQRAVGVLLLSAGLMIQLLLPVFNVRRGAGMHFAEGLLLGLAIALLVGSLVVRKSKCLPEQG